MPLFSISKSENKNQVQYAIRVDDSCAPVGRAPVFAYWRMLERGPTQYEQLLPREEKAYGIASQLVASRSDSGGDVHLTLNALPGRPIDVQTVRSDDGCRGYSTTAIGGAPAHLFNVHARLKWPFGVDYLLLQGWTLDGAKVVQEKLQG